MKRGKKIYDLRNMVFLNVQTLKNGLQENLRDLICAFRIECAKFAIITSDLISNQFHIMEALKLVNLGSYKVPNPRVVIGMKYI